MDGTEKSEKKSYTAPIHTREQFSKETGVSIAKYDVVMKSDNEELNKIYYHIW